MGAFLWLRLKGALRFECVLEFLSLYANGALPGALLWGESDFLTKVRMLEWVISRAFTDIKARETERN